MPGPHRIKVYVRDYGAKRKYLQLQWTDPITGKLRTESSRCTRRRDAERKALEKENTLNSEKEIQESPEATRGLEQASESIEWRRLVGMYLNLRMKGLKTNTQIKKKSVLTQFEQFKYPSTPQEITALHLARYVDHMRESGRQETTIASHLRELRALLQWAKDHECLAVVPKFPKLEKAKQQKVMKGRPITDEEFERMVAQASVGGGASNRDSWIHILTGLWLSGLRLAESLQLSWDASAPMCIDLSDEFPVFRVPAEHDKSGEDRILPMTPDFAEWLLQTPADKRSGWVFRPVSEKHGEFRNPSNVSRGISAIGEAAGIVVDPKTGKFASAHDLRRSFGFRWSQRAMPPVLKELMRHDSIETTLRYYVGQDAQRTAQSIWSQWGQKRDDTNVQDNTFHNTKPPGKRKRP